MVNGMEDDMPIVVRTHEDSGCVRIIVLTKLGGDVPRAQIM